MINYKELYQILGYNNITSVSTEEAVAEALGHLNYNEADKQEAIRFLKSQGWMGGASAPASSAAPVQAAPSGQPETIAAQPEVRTAPPVINNPAASVAEDVSSLEPLAKKRNNLAVLLVGLLLLVLLAGGGLLYAHTMKIWPFGAVTYSEADFLPGIMEKADQIKTASYVFSLNMDVVERDSDAKPFALDETSNAALLRRQYENDSQRIDDIQAIIRRLNELADYDSYDYKYGSAGDKAAVIKPSYPESIAEIFSGMGKDDADYSYYYYEDASVKDPATGKIYDYRVTDGGSNFQLTVSFETNEAMKAVEKYGNGYDYDEEDTGSEQKATTIYGKKATFTRDSSDYIYMSGEPPKPFFESLSDSLRMISPDTKISGSVSAASELTDDTLPDWKFNADAAGDFGDLTYKINIDALKKGEDYYVKINNFPSLFFLDLGPFKGKWLRISPDELAKEDDSYSMFSSLKENMADMEKDFKEDRRKSVKFSKEVIKIADEENLVSFKNKPKVEKAGDRQLVKYDLKINKNAVLPFYAKLQESIDNDPDFDEYRDSIDQGLIDYLKSDEFDQVFDYFETNNQFVFWTDKEGFPAAFENTLRVVPPDTATQLKDKQIDIVFGLTTNDINKDIVIEAPKDSVPIDKAIEDYENNLDISEIQTAPEVTENSQLMKIIGSLRASVGSFWK